MKNKPVCFVISPIGEAGSDIRKNADDLLEEIIKPALLSLHIDEVKRGDDLDQSGTIDADVVRYVQEADLCIADISEYNPNVYYEIGRRDETGKYIILMKRKDSPEAPVDIRTRRHIVYDFSLDGMKNAKNELKEWIRPMQENAFVKPGSTSSSLPSKAVDRFESLLNDLKKTIESLSVKSPEQDNKIIPLNNNETFRSALEKCDIPRVEAFLEQIEPTEERWNFYDNYVIDAANIGSKKAGDMLVETAREYFEQSGRSFHERATYLKSLLGYSKEKTPEKETIVLLEDLTKILVEESKSGDFETDDLVQIYYRLSLIHYDIFNSTGKGANLQNAVTYLEEAQKTSNTSQDVDFALAMCYFELSTESGSPTEYIEKAEVCIRHAFEIKSIEETDNAENLKLAHKIFTKHKDAEDAEKVLARLREVDPAVASKIESKK